MEWKYYKRDGLDPVIAGEFLKIFRVIYNNDYLRLIEIIRAEPGYCATDLAMKMGKTIGSIGHKLRTLESIGIVYTVRNGKFSHYYPLEKNMEVLEDMLELTLGILKRREMNIR